VVGRAGLRHEDEGVLLLDRPDHVTLQRVLVVEVDRCVQAAINTSPVPPVKMSEELPLPFWKTCSFTVAVLRRIPSWPWPRSAPTGPVVDVITVKVWTPPVEWLDDPAPPDEQADNTAANATVIQRRF